MQAPPPPAADAAADEASALTHTLKNIVDGCILARQYDKLVATLRMHSADVAFVQHTFRILRTWTETKHNIPAASDVDDMLQAAPSSTIAVLGEVMKNHLRNADIQINGFFVLSFFALHYGDKFPAEHIVPLCTVALQAMSMCVVDSGIDTRRLSRMHSVQKGALKLLNVVSSQDANQGSIDDMRNAGGYDLVLLVLQCLKKVHSLHAGMDPLQLGNTTQTRVADTLDNIFLCYELLGRFSSKWLCPSDRLVGVDDEMYLCVTDTMNAFPHCVQIQTRGCLVLTQLAILNLNGLNRNEMPHIMCALNLLQNQSVSDCDQFAGSRALLKFVEEDCGKQLYNREAQDIMGATGAVPVLLNRLKRMYDTNNNTAKHAEYLVGILDVLNSITIRHHKNCELLYLADGVTLITAVISARRIQKVNSVEIAGVRVLCHMLERMFCYNKELKDAMYIRARTVQICPSKNLMLHEKAHFHPISIIMTTAMKKTVPALVINDCLDALCACAQSTANRAVIGSTGVALAVTLDKAGYTGGAIVLLSRLTYQGAFADDRSVIKLATRKTIPQDVRWNDALLQLKRNLKIVPQASATSVFAHGK